MMIAGTLGWTIDAPADAEYAVLPVGVDIMRPATVIYQWTIVALLTGTLRHRSTLYFS